ncbi:hypothetical protein ACFU6S_43125 [Streptomyces sp. NPDC057456]|uniref:hypothetical protein n=1 Tax=Streptomyces sp. NPDC057456 TaxID=3346139 RepID=UPI0036AF155B
MPQIKRLEHLRETLAVLAISLARTHGHLAITAERQAEQAGHGHQEHDQSVPEQKAGRWLSRLRT